MPNYFMVIVKTKAVMPSSLSFTAVLIFFSTIITPNVI